MHTPLICAFLCSECVKFNSIMCERFYSHLRWRFLALSLLRIVIVWILDSSASNYKLISEMFVFLFVRAVLLADYVSSDHRWNTFTWATRATRTHKPCGSERTLTFSRYSARRATEHNCKQFHFFSLIRFDENSFYYSHRAAVTRHFFYAFTSAVSFCFCFTQIPRMDRHTHLIFSFRSALRLKFNSIILISFALFHCTFCLETKKK